MVTVSATIYPFGQDLRKSQPLVAAYAQHFAIQMQDQISADAMADRFLRKRQMDENVAELAAATTLAVCDMFPTYRKESTHRMRSITRTLADFCLNAQVALLMTDEAKPVRATRIRQIATHGRQAYENYTSSARLLVAANG